MYTILIAEDDDASFFIYNLILKKEQYILIRALDGKSALDIVVENSNIQLIIMDMIMPIMDGFEAIPKIKALKPSMSIIAITGFSSEDEKKKIKETGCNFILTKPFKKEDLLNTITLLIHTIRK